MPLILFTFPGSVKCRGRNFCLHGQVNNTSPPPSGAAPRLLIYKETEKNTFNKNFSDDVMLCDLSVL